MFIPTSMWDGRIVSYNNEKYICIGMRKDKTITGEETTHFLVKFEEQDEVIVTDREAIKVINGDVTIDWDIKPYSVYGRSHIRGVYTIYLEKEGRILPKFSLPERKE